MPWMRTGGERLQAAAENCRPGSVRVLLGAGTDPQRDPSEGLTPIGWVRPRVGERGLTPGHEEVQRLLNESAAH